MSRSPRFAAQAGSLLLLLLATTAHAVTITWTGGAANGSWHSASNWDLARVPGAGDDVSIPDLGGTASVLFNSGSTSINSLACAEVFILAGGSLDMAASSSVSNMFTLDGGTLTGAADFQISGGFYWPSGTMSGTGTTTITSVSWTLDDGVPTLNGRTLRNDGACTMIGVSGNAFQMTNSAVFQNRTGSTFDIQGVTARIEGTASTLFDNQAGALFKKSINGAVSQINTSFTNGGSVSLLEGTLQFRKPSTNNGSMTSSNNGTLLDIAADFTFAAGSSLTPAGAIYFTGGASTIDAASTFTPGGAVRIAATLTLDCDAIIPTLDLSSGTLTGAGNIVVATGMGWDGSTMSGTGTTTINPSVSWSLSPSSATLSGRTLLNDGICIKTGSNPLQMANSAVFRNRSGSTFDIQSDGIVVSGPAGTLFDNQAGALFKKSINGGSSDIATSFTNGGTVSLLEGTLRFTQPSTSNGSMTSSNNGTLLNIFTSFTFAAGSSLTPAGAIYFTGGASTIDAASTFTPGGTVRIAATLTLDCDATIPTLDLSSGTLTGAGNIVVATGMYWDGSTLSGTGTTTINPSVSWTLNPSSAILSGRTLLNDGICTKIGTNRLQMTNSAVFRNRTGSTFDIQDDAVAIGGSASELFDNQAGALLKKSAGSSASDIITTFTNDGTVQVTIGILRLTGLFTNFSANTLTGGTYVLQGGELRFTGADIITNAATIVLDTPTSLISSLDPLNGLRNLATNAPAGSLTIKNGRNLSNASLLTNAGTVVVGPGASTLTSNLGFTQTAGTTRLDGGTLASSALVDIQGGLLTGSGTVSGNLRNAGLVAPGVSPGEIAVTGDYTQTASGQYAAELEGVSGGEYDALNVSGTATLDGNLTASLINGFNPIVDDLFDVLTCSSRSGTFATTNLPIPSGTGCVALIYRAMGVRLQRFAPVIVTVPPQSQIVCDGQPASFSVTVMGGGSNTYQWRRNDVNIGGATAPTFALGAAAPANAGSYDVVVTGPCGPTTSNVASLTVLVGPYTVNVSSSAHGSVSPPGPESVQCDGSVKFTMTPDPDYGIGDVLADGQSVGAGASYTFNGVRGNHTLEAIFADLMPPTVSLLAPNLGMVVQIGLTVRAVWTATDAVGIASVDLLLSRTGSGGPFTNIAHIEPAPDGDDFYTWVADGPPTNDAYMKVEGRDARGNLTFDLSDESFRITSTVDAPAALPSRFALARVAPNPMREGADVAFALPREAVVRLTVIDLQGREIATLVDGWQSAGHHHLRLDATRENLNGGLYFLRYETPVRTFVERFVVTK